jgi:uncharacterized protein DUF4170
LASAISTLAQSAPVVQDMGQPRCEMHRSGAIRSRADRGRIMSQQKTKTQGKQLLHLVFGGELTDLDAVQFKDLDKLDIVGIYPNYAEAEKAWKAAAQRSVDNAQMRYFVVHMHRLMETEPHPDEDDE